MDMICVFCRRETKVANSRPAKVRPEVWRRRQCLSCSKVFSTKEQPDFSSAFTVTGKQGQEEAFSHDKLLFSIHSCLSHRKDAISASNALQATVIARLLRQLKGTNVIDSRKIAETTYKVLLRFDKPAAVYYKAHFGM